MKFGCGREQLKSITPTEANAKWPQADEGGEGWQLVDVQTEEDFDKVLVTHKQIRFAKLFTSYTTLDSLASKRCPPVCFLR